MARNNRLPAIAGRFRKITQVIDLAQTNTAANSITKDNSGKITADEVGLFAEINNELVGTLINEAFLFNVNGGAAVVTANALEQSIEPVQINTIASSILLTNSGEVDPEIGILARINNQAIGVLANLALSENINGDAAVIALEDAAQEIDVTQNNVIASRIVIDNSGDTVADETGILAEINNRAIGILANEALNLNLNGTAAVIEFGDLTQDIYVTQANAIESSIAVTNSGTVDPGTGIAAEINNQAIGDLFNYTDSINVSGDAALIGVGDVRQSVDAVQFNTLDSGIDVVSAAGITADGAGIQALIRNTAIDWLENDFEPLNLHGDAALIAAGELTQTASSEQTNIIASDIFVDNTGDIEAGEGIVTEIENRTEGWLSNFSDAINATGTASLVDDEDLTQHSAANQLNRVESTITLLNSGTVDASGDGLAAKIINRDLSLENIAWAENTHDATAVVDGHLSQSADAI